MSDKPPLGIMPKKIWEMHRANELLSAIERYSYARIWVPNQWFEDLRYLINKEE